MCLPLYGAVGGASGAQGALSFILSVGEGGGASMLVSEKKAAEKQQQKNKKKDPGCATFVRCKGNNLFFSFVILFSLLEL